MVRPIRGHALRRANAGHRAKIEQLCLERLRLELAISIRGRIDLSQPGVSYSPSALWLKRCRGGRIVVNRDHDEFPAMLAEALDVLHAAAFNRRRQLWHLYARRRS